jgi:tetratricopeptide (TPR) repeat protein
MAVVNLTRGRLYVMIEAFESDMRRFIRDYLLSHRDASDVLGDQYQRASERVNEDTSATDSDIADFLDIRPTFDILSRNRSELPAEIVDDLRQIGPLLGEFAPLRNRVMHGRPLKSGDPDRALVLMNSLASRFWVQSVEVLHRLSSEPDWTPLGEVLESPMERVLHNLPQADYNETGLIGREAIRSRLLKALKERRTPMVTITGEGGVGKTALALDVAYAIVDDEQTPYDCVLWVSLKAEVLTHEGVKALANGIRDVTGATGALGRVLDKSFSGSVTDLADMLEGIETLIVLDNLESVRGDEVLELFEQLPASVTYLFTSRLGIGQVERRVPLEPLAERDAVLLLRALARSRFQVRLATLSEKAALQVVGKLRNSPLAIRWFVQSVEAGQDPIGRINDQSELLEFCVRNVFEAVSDRAKTILAILRVVDRSMSFNEIAVIAESEIDDLRRASQDLDRGSLIVVEPDAERGLAGRLRLSSTAREYLPRVDDARLPTRVIEERQRNYAQSVERLRNDELRGELAPTIVHRRTAADEPAAHLLRLALLKSRNALDVSEKYVARARALAPDYWEVDRVAGFIAASNHEGERALTYYREALEKTDDSRDRAVVAHYYSGHLARYSRDLNAAEIYARESHSELCLPATAAALGRILTWSEQFDESLDVLNEGLALLDENPARDGRTRVILVTSIIDSWKRKSEFENQRRAHTDALISATSGAQTGFSAIRESIHDRKLLAALIESIEMVLVVLARKPDLYTANRLLVESTLSLLEGRALTDLSSLAEWSRLENTARGLLREPALGETFAVHARRLIDARAKTKRDDGDNPERQRKTGFIKTWNGNFGFIAHYEYPDNLFVHRGELARELNDLEQLEGVEVRFSVIVHDGRTRAASVELSDG